MHNEEKLRKQSAAGWSVGIRNHNYLNVKNTPANPWKESIGTDGRGHAQFSSPEWGIRAAIITLRTYWLKHNLHSIAQILARWAPDTDTVGSLTGGSANSPAQYSSFVARRLGVNPTDNLHLFHPNGSLRSPRTLKALLQAMAAYENGSNFQIPDHCYEKGLQLVEGV